MSARLRLTDLNNAGADLETALREIKGVAGVLYSLEEPTGDSAALSYLSDRPHEHREEAMDAFRRILGSTSTGKGRRCVITRRAIDSATHRPNHVLPGWCFSSTAETSRLLT
jgi:hypothetical protein